MCSTSGAPSGTVQKRTALLMMMQERRGEVNTDFDLIRR